MGLNVTGNNMERHGKQHSKLNQINFKFYYNSFFNFSKTIYLISWMFHFYYNLKSKFILPLNTYKLCNSAISIMNIFNNSVKTSVYVITIITN